MKVKSLQNIEGEFELNKNTLSLCILSKGRTSRMNLSIKLKLSENTQRGKLIEKKVICEYY